MKETINAGGPPTTREWNEFEARQPSLPGSDRLRITLPKGTPNFYGLIIELITMRFGHSVVLDSAVVDYHS